MKVAVVTLGCRANHSESDVIQESLEEAGVTIVSLKDKPDYCIVNTCSVTHKGDIDSRQMIGRAARAGAKVIVTGCYTQLNRKAAESLPGVVSLVDIGRKYDIIRMIAGADAEPCHHVSGRSRPYVKVQDGCDFNCSYCTVCIARGRSRSLPDTLIIERVAALSDSGYKEVVLTGINLGLYGRDLPQRDSIAGLIRKLLSGTSIRRIRLSSLDICGIDDELIDVISDPRICRNLHIPLQSGSNKVLGLMRRRYRMELVSSRFRAITSRFSDIAIGTDLIVGFPGEGSSEFQDTVDLIRAWPFAYLHVFPYSPRPNTDAFVLAGAACSSEVRRRADTLLELGREKKADYMTSQIGKILEIIMEKGLRDGMSVGTSSNYLKISVPQGGHRPGSVAVVRVAGIRSGRLEGVVIKDP
ncbi:MAG: tRNA (N(6)-L-threonylcarbamoyladenosine(37)-C(2))-methylthiotransferase MtaB [Nitrospiraceae bacterium]|nr:tRNA (N(6)-L-threonylcarbamoyladenosine(37)-C(2))-methylthiotransferase MtaB [Nitrospiraceae bacterium]